MLISRTNCRTYVDIVHPPPIRNNFPIHNVNSLPLSALVSSLPLLLSPLLTYCFSNDLFLVPPVTRGSPNLHRRVRCILLPLLSYPPFLSSGTPFLSLPPSSRLLSIPLHLFRYEDGVEGGGERGRGGGGAREVI